jgi:hypothetical protein
MLEPRRLHSAARPFRKAVRKHSPLPGRRGALIQRTCEIESLGADVLT